MTKLLQDDPAFIAQLEWRDFIISILPILKDRAAYSLKPKMGQVGTYRLGHIDFVRRYSGGEWEISPMDKSWKIECSTTTYSNKVVFSGRDPSDDLIWLKMAL